MKNRKWKKILRAVIISLMLLVMLLPISNYAAGMIDMGKEVSLTVTCLDGEDALVGMQFKIYQVGEIDAYGYVSALKEYRVYKVDMTGEKDHEWRAVASTLQGYVLRDKIKPSATVKTDSEGNAELTKIEKGLYLVLGSRHAQDGKVYETEPFLVLLPKVREGINEWEYDISVSPKHSSKPIAQKPELFNRRVLKIWDDKGHEEERPKEINVELLRDGELYESVVLNEDNGWSYTWKDLEDTYSWDIAEEEQEGYSPLGEWESATYVITNKYIEKTEDKEDDTSETVKPEEVKPDDTTAKPNKPSGNLAQTGQLWWPVPMLVAVGLLFIVIGLLRYRSNKYAK